MVRTDYRTLFREQVFAGIEEWRAEFNALQTHDRDKIRQSYRARPATFHPPCVYIGPVSEVFRHNSQSKSDILTGQIVVVRGLYDNEEAVQWRDRATWSLHEWLTDHKNYVSTKTIVQPTGTDDAELDMGSGTVYLAGLVNVTLDILFGLSGS